MRSADLVREWLAASPVHEQRHLDILAGQGISGGRLVRKLRVGTVLPCTGDGCGLFQPDEGGREVFLAEVQIGFAGHTADLVAWAPSKPERWRLRTGTATLLGAEAVAIESLDDGPLHLDPHPAAWIAAGADRYARACILDWSPPQVRLALAPARHRRIVCANLRLGQRLASAVKPPPEDWRIHVALQDDGRVAA
jgi:hypothetical protein